jgi:hypothetical protein
MVRSRIGDGKPVHTDTSTEAFCFHANGHARKVRKLTFLLSGRVAYGTLTVVEGRKGAGKSTFMAALAAAVTGGPRLPGCRKKHEAAPVLWLTREESYEQAVLPRIVAGGGNRKLVLWPQSHNGDVPPRMVFPGHFTELEKAIDLEGMKLVIMDPWTSSLDPRHNQNDEQAVRDFTDPLIEIGHRTGCAILLARHLRKSASGHTLDHGSGSVAIGAAARSVLRIDAVPGRPGWSAAYSVATNLGPKPAALAWQLEDAGNVARVVWGKELDLDADDLAAGTADAGERDERDDATTCLRSVLKDGWATWTDIRKAGLNYGVSDKTLRRRKAELGIPSRRCSGGGSHWSEWGPPAKGWPK